MCGLACILRITEPPPERWSDDAPPPPPEQTIPDDWLDGLDASIAWRGPDDSGRFRDRAELRGGRVIDVAIVHRRLSIIDHETGAQPMFSATPAPGIAGTLEQGRGLVAAAFNGCVYNHRALREELEALGHVFVSDHADAEVWVHGWRAWGRDVAGRIEGMFAAVVWDREAAELVLLRDRFGEKPLYLSGEVEHRVWLAASTTPGLRRLVGELGGEDQIEPGATAEWLSLGYHTETTPYPSIVQLPHGSIVTAPATTAIDTARLHRKGLAGRLPGDWARSRPSLERRRTALGRIDGVIRGAVEERLEADVPVGCFLSGGVDSTLIAEHASALLRDAGGRLTTVCVSMPDPAYDESEWAAHVGEIIGSDHRTIPAEPDPADDLVLLIQTLGLPFGDSSLLPTFWACRAAAREVGVALSGDGGDELFLGYERYRAASWLALAKLAGTLDQPLPRHDPKSRWDKLARLIQAARGRGYRDLLAIFPVVELRPLLGIGPLRDPGLVPDTPDTIAKARDYDLRHHLPGDMLRKVDTASMLAGLEVRAPLLDSRVADAALRMPIRRVRLGRRRKGILRELVRNRFGPELADRPKMGFAVPIGRWFREDFGGLRQLLNDHLRSSAPFPGIPLDIQPKRLAVLLDQHDSMRRDHGQRFYALLVLSIWAHSEAPPIAPDGATGGASGFS